ncbi:hypothetical protein GGF50DRAFT_101455 [Schizophyllum commune]
MGLLGYFSSSKVNLVKPDAQGTKQDAAAPSARSAGIAESSAEESNGSSSASSSPSAPSAPLPEEHDSKADSPIVAPSKRARRFSLKTLSFSPSHKAALSTDEEHKLREDAAEALEHRVLKRTHTSAADRRAKESAHLVRALIVGPDPVTPSSPKVTKAVAKPQLGKVKSQLMKPKEANRVITQLRALSSSDAQATEHGAKGPIHAVCLAHSEEKEDELHFSKLAQEDDSPPLELPNFLQGNATAAKLRNVIDEMHIVDLLLTPDLGLGQSGDGKGILSGAVPTAETVINGVQQITPQLMALGYATGRAILPDHAGVYPPTDRISVLTYWWGLELCLPPPTLSYLASAKSVSGQLVNFLTALSLVNNGVKELLPFVRYISQFIDFEFDTITKQNHGQGVVCAATWIMPAALVPRPWDFPEKPDATSPPAQPIPKHESPIPEEPEDVPAGPDIHEPAPDINQPAPEPPAKDSPSPAPPVTIAPIPMAPTLASQVIALTEEPTLTPSPVPVSATA